MNQIIKPKIAVLVAVYNGAEWLEEQLNSILAQEGVDVTVFISIDLSTDGSEFLCCQLLTQHKNIVLLPNVGKFGSAAINFFRLVRDVNFSDFDYVSFSDQDDIWQMSKLLRAVKVMLHNNANAYSSNVIAFWLDGCQKTINKAQQQQKWDYILESAGPGCTFVLSKNLALDLQQFLIKNQNDCKSVALHDWFIYAFARSRGFKWLIDNESHMLYRQHARNVVGANVGFKAMMARWQKLREGWLVKQSLLIADILAYSHIWPIQKLKRYHFVDRLALIANVNRLRRRLRDRIGLALFLLSPQKK